jgi:hypothetical protein
MFQQDGYVTVSEYPILINDKPRRVDVVAAKWLGNDSFNAIAIECKLGSDCESVGQALNQAIAYQTVFPRVYIASEASKENLGYMKTVLADLGLGYMQVISKQDPIHVILEPTDSSLYNNKQFRLHVLNQLGRLVVWNDYWGEDEVKSGKSGLSGFWIAGRIRRKCNYLFEFISSGVMWIGINFESTEYLRKFFQSTTPSGLLDTLRKIPSDAEIIISDFKTDKHGRKTPASKVVEWKRFPLTHIQLGDINKIFKHANEMNHYIWFLVVKEWTYLNAKMSYRTFKAEVEQLENEFKPMYDFILKNIYRKGKTKK